MKIIVGLGNPGLKYRETRHNVGFKVIDELRKRHKPEEVIKSKYFRGWKIKIENFFIILCKPKTFMNESGVAVKGIVERYNVELENLIVVHDDLDIPLGKIKIGIGKGAGGHKGVISIMENLSSRDFIRVRIGIGGRETETSYINYVLSPFLPHEKEIISTSIKKAADACEIIIKSGIEKAMTEFNR